MSKWILIGPVVGVVLLVVGLVLGYAVFPPLVEQKIIESVELLQGTDQYERWKEVPQPLDFKVYLFNVTNVEEIQAGGVPKIEEVGPFIYSQYRRKYNIRFSRDKERASYYQQLRFEFNAEKSAPLTQDDKIVVLNMYMNSILQMVEEETVTLMGLINTAMNAVFGTTTSFFVETTPRKFLFEGVEFCVDPVGIALIICSQIEERNSTTITKTADKNSLKFAMFAHKNNTHDGRYEINTGIRRLDKLLKVEKWHNARTLSMWKPDKLGAPSTCQFINGTDATAAAPFRKEHDDFYIFSSDICRSVHLYWDSKTNYQGINGYRYVTKNDFLNEIGTQYGTECFCVNKIKNALVDDDGCLYQGALDLTECVGAPVVITLPHFYGANEKYGLLVDGLNPSADKHQIYMDIEPRTGSPLRGGKKVQFNMFLKQLTRITLSEKFEIPRLFPVAWVDEGLELNDDMVNMIKSDLVNVLTLLSAVQWSLVGVGAALVVCMLIWYFMARKKVTKTTSIDPIIEGKKGDTTNS